MSGYAYNSESPLKEVYYRVNGETAEHLCSGNYYPRRDVAQQAGYSVDNATRSGFGSVEDPLLLTGLELDCGVYALQLMARFENGTETEIAAPVLIVIPEAEYSLYDFSGECVGVYPGALNQEAGIEHSYYPPDREDEYVLFNGTATDSFCLGDLHFGLFSRCEIEYYTAVDWQPYAAGSMAEPAFVALKRIDSSSGYGGNGPYKDGMIASATLTAPEPGSGTYTSLRTAVIDLSGSNYSGPVFLSAYPSTSGPVYVTRIAFYF